MFLYQVQYLAEIKNSLKILQKNLSTGLNVFSDKIYGTRSSESFFCGGGEGGGVWWEGVECGR